MRNLCLVLSLLASSALAQQAIQLPEIKVPTTPAADTFRFVSEGPIGPGWTRPDEVEVGYRYRRSTWGRGVATEAAAPLVQIALADPATTAIVACTAAGNAGSLRVLKKLGLERVGEVMLPETSEPAVKLARVK